MAIALGLACGVPWSQSDEAQRFYEEADRVGKEGQYKEAIANLEKACLLAPANDLYVASLSHYERLDHRFDSGFAHATRAIELNPKVGWYYASAAFNAHEGFHLADALKYARKVRELGVDRVGQANFDAATDIVDALDRIDLAAQGLAQGTRPEGADQVMAFARQKGIQIVWDREGAQRSYPVFRTIGPKPAAVQIALPFVQEAFAWLPDALGREARFKVILTGSLVTQDLSSSAGVADWGVRSMALDVDHYHLRKQVCRTLIHESFHLLEGVLANPNNVQAWDELNEPGFTYVGYQEFGKADANRKGFITPYAQSAGQEDRADLFMLMLTDPETVAKKVRDDPILQRKVDAIKQMTFALSPQMGEEFWRRAEAGAFKPHVNSRPTS